MEDWNERLLSHFFRKHEPTLGAISTLLVTSEELAVATGDAAADPKLVRDSFVKAVLDGIPAGSGLLEHAFDLSFNPAETEPIPPYIAHLFITCLAAAESSEDLASEESFIERLRTLSEGRSNENVLHFLRPLWERLSLWLALEQNRETYRQLILPELGAHTRIGYSEKLAFPDRRDQRAFCTLLREHGFVGQEPPPAKIVSIVASSKNRFRRGFLEAHEDFRNRFLDGANGGSRFHLRTHPFWSSTIDAVMRGRAAEERTVGSARVQLVATWDGEAFEPYLLSEANSGRLPQGAELKPLESPVDPWRFTLVPQGGGPSRALLNEFLAGRIRIPKLSAIADQNVLPFYSASADYLELAASKEEVAVTEFALVRSEALPDIIRFFSAKVAEGIRFAADWHLVTDLRMVPVPAEELEASSLKRCWLLHDTLPSVRIRLMGGVRTEDGWLGYAQVLPQLTATGAVAVTMTANGCSRPLKQARLGCWDIPSQDITGQITFRAFDERERVLDILAVRFSAAPATETFRMPAEPRSYYHETVWGACLSSDAVVLSDRAAQPNFGQQLGQVIYLGSDQGAFVGDEKEAAWVVSKSGSYQAIREAASPNGGTPPRFRATHKGLARRWRKLLEQSHVDTDDTSTLNSRSIARKRLAEAPPLDQADFPVGCSPIEYQPDTHDPLPAVTKIAAALAGRAASRTGVPFSEWCFFLEKFAGVSGYAEIDVITRSWSEAGFIDVLTFARWRSKSVFPIQPRLMLYQSGAAFVGYLAGLALLSTKARLVRLAEEHEIHCSERKSFCRYTPSTLVLASTDFDSLMRVAAAGGVEVAWAALHFAAAAPVAVEEGAALPTGYELRKRIADWSLSPSRLPRGDFRLSYWSRDDRPGYWSMLRPDGTGDWSFQKNGARLLACSQLGIDAFEAKGLHEIKAIHAFLPLPLARQIAMLSPVLPGSFDVSRADSEYTYAFFTSPFRDETLRLAHRMVSPRPTGEIFQSNLSHV